jgi:hypothetical protein
MEPMSMAENQLWADIEERHPHMAMPVSRILYLRDCIVAREWNLI